jgi:beta-N-acetylhexosaminidase
VLTELRRVRALDAVAIFVATGLLTFVALKLTTGEDPKPTPVAATVAGTETAATTKPAGDSVGSVEVGADGELKITGSVPKLPAATTPARPKPAGQPANGPVTNPAKATAKSSSLAADVGQMIVSPVAGMTADAALLTRIRGGQVGSVILFANNISTVGQVRKLVDDLQAAAKASGHPPLLVMADQEGGVVKRFRTAPPSLSAQQMGAASSPGSTAHQQGQSTGTAMRQRGVNVDLAPVADIPVGPTFLSTRAFSRSAQTVATAACQFAAGLHAAGVGSALKHFPGLGRAGNINTDAAPVTITGMSAQDLSAYRQCANGAGTMVMMANAAYSGLTGSTPAVLSNAAYGMLRDQVGFRGVTVTDSLNAGALKSQSNIAVRAAQAGIDLELWTSVAGAQQAYQQVLAAATGGQLSRDRIGQAARRVRALKNTVGPA